MAEKNLSPVEIEDFAVREHRSLWLDAWRRLKANRTAMIGLVVVLIFMLSAVYAHFFWEYNPKMDLDYGAKLLPPQLRVTEESPKIHLFGTDKLGRDIFRRTVHGGWNSLRVGLVAVSISLTIGGILGLLAGFFESIEMYFWESLALMSFLGVALGALPAWIANQPFQVILFGALGIASVIVDKTNLSKLIRRLLFAGLGMLIGGIAWFFSSTSGWFGVWHCWVGIGYLGYPCRWQTFLKHRHAHHGCNFSFPSYLLAIAIVAFLGPGLRKGMIAIGIVGIPVYARLARSAVCLSVKKNMSLHRKLLKRNHTVGSFSGISYRISFRQLLCKRPWVWQMRSFQLRPWVFLVWAQFHLSPNGVQCWVTATNIFPVAPGGLFYFQA